jgi:hypothetical protein
VKTTLDLPDELFREVKSTAAKRGVLMKEFITEALTEKLALSVEKPDPKPWMALAGCAANDPEMRAELRRIDKIIEEEFGQVDEADWK